MPNAAVTDRAPGPAASSAPPPIELLGVDAAHEHGAGMAAIEDVNWRVGAGEFWAVGGLQGAGKSVLLAAAAGINRPLRGKLRLFADELTDPPNATAFAHLLRIGLVFEGDGRLFGGMTVAENVALPLLYHGRGDTAEITQAVQVALETVELTELADALAARLPRHLRQRAALARALALQPEVLLVDNPLGRQTAREAEWWLRTLRRLAEGFRQSEGRPLTLVVTADDLHPWRNGATHFAVLDQRRLRIVGGRAELEACTEECVRELLMT
jgi:ABC-type transporter Mla maintaining outer membrane lipid asymmetry ATPase subunit MlaF